MILPIVRTRYRHSGSLSRLAALVGLACTSWLAACGGSDPVTLDPGDPLDPLPPAQPVCTGSYCDSIAIAARGLETAFYSKILVTGGMPIISSSKVDDRALEIAATVVDSMLALRPDVRTAMVALSARVGIMDIGELTTDIPEHAFLKNDILIDWDARARGLGGTPEVPITTVGEENLLCLDKDVYAGENILIHEFAHAVLLMGIAFVDESFQGELETLFGLARSEGLWSGTYANTSPGEYWAEGVQSWFDSNQVPQPGIHNTVNTRAELLQADPRLYELISRYMPPTDWRPTCP